MRCYDAPGFTNEPRFTDETAACMVLSDTIRVMLLTHDKWKTFTTRPIPPSDSSEVMLAISCESKEEVNRLADTAGANGGIADPNPVQDHGFMRSEEHTSELQSLMRISYAVFCLKKKNTQIRNQTLSYRSMLHSSSITYKL